MAIKQTYAEVGKLYLATPSSSANIGGRGMATIEIKGNVNLIVYGSEEAEASILAVSDMTPASDSIGADFYQTFYKLPKYVAFIGTADRINVTGYDLTEIKAIT